MNWTKGQSRLPGSIGIFPVIDGLVVPVPGYQNSVVIDEKIVQLLIYPVTLIMHKIVRFQDAITRNKYVIIIIPFIENVFHRGSELWKTAK